MAKILCVDDNETNRYMIEKILERAGFTVCTASDGEAGIAAAQAERPGLILMDIQMPGIDGFEATRRLKAGPDTGHIPIIALSAHEADEKAEEIAASGCDSYLTKPLDFAKLLTLVNALLSASAEDSAANPSAPERRSAEAAGSDQA